MSLLTLAGIFGLLSLVLFVLPGRKPRPGARTGKPTASPELIARLRAEAEALALRGAVFAVTEAGQVAGCDLTPLGEVWLTRPQGVEAEGALKAKAAALFPGCRALVGLTRRAVGEGVEWRATACAATPRDRGQLPKTRRRPPVLVDASNVIMWAVNAGLEDAPSLAPLQAVIRLLLAEGKPIEAICDASFGHRLEGRFLSAREIEKRLGNPRLLSVKVVDKGQIADRHLIARAQASGAAIVTNDLYRDHSESRFIPKRRGWYVEGQAGVLDGAV